MPTLIVQRHPAYSTQSSELKVLTYFIVNLHDHVIRVNNQFVLWICLHWTNHCKDRMLVCTRSLPAQYTTQVQYTYKYYMYMVKYSCYDVVL